MKNGPAKARPAGPVLPPMPYLDKFRASHMR